MSALGVVLPAHFMGAHRIKKCHATLIYLGEHDAAHDVFRRRPAVETAVARLNLGTQLLSPRVTGVEVFGNGTKTVLILEDTALKSYRKFLDQELSRVGIRSASNWAYRPHVTINSHEKSDQPILPDWFTTPERVYLDLPVLWWASPDGDE